MAVAWCSFFTTGVPVWQSRKQALPVRQREQEQVVFCISSGKGRNEAAARDWEVTFGKYRGSMMGTLPSRYLKWMTSNLSGELEEWADRAKEVLQDPYYRERLEWEQIEKHMDKRHSSFVLQHQLTGQRTSALAPALAFGWDLDDEDGWGKVNFSLLGTTRGGRIPRLKQRPELPTPVRNTAKISRKEVYRSPRGSYNGPGAARAQAVPQDQAEVSPQGGGSLREEMLRRRQLRRDRVAASKAPRITAESAAAEMERLFPGREGLIQKIRDIS